VVTSNTDASFSIIPSSSTAKLSIRYVPKQSEKRVQEVVEAHLRHEFAKLNSPNEVGALCRGPGGLFGVQIVVEMAVPWS
jgi:acetylornithine deacetylase/succinyl-diaminopimelate desuccinylase-like protein